MLPEDPKSTKNSDLLKRGNYWIASTRVTMYSILSPQKEFVLFIKLFAVTNMEIPKNTVERITRPWFRSCLHKSIGGRLRIHFWSGSLWNPLSSSMLKNKRIFSLVIAFSLVITEMTENFTEAIKYLTKLKETLRNYVWEKSHFIKQ